VVVEVATNGHLRLKRLTSEPEEASWHQGGEVDVLGVDHGHVHLGADSVQNRVEVLGVSVGTSSGKSASRGCEKKLKAKRRRRHRVCRLEDRLGDVLILGTSVQHERVDEVSLMAPFAPVDARDLQDDPQDLVPSTRLHRGDQCALDGRESDGHRYCWSSIMRNVEPERS
jgi:hypothetical protein